MERMGLRRAQEMLAPLVERTRHFRVYDSWLIPGLFRTMSHTTTLLQAVAVRLCVPDDIEEAAHAVAPTARVVCVDHDPVAGPRHRCVWVTSVFEEGLAH